MFLAGQLLHRTAQTDHERRAAEFIQTRFREYTPYVELDDFYSIDNYTWLFASYFTEFLVVGVLAIWWPAFAAIYGASVFLTYLAEFMGYRIFSRFMPHYESQNVIARFMGNRPRHLFVVAAHYDSGGASLLSTPQVVPVLRRIHAALVLAMFTVIATCAIEAFGRTGGAEFAWLLPLRWTAITLLLAAAILLFYTSTQTEDIRGANTNASGVAALLNLAEKLAASPIENADIWLVATGSHESWMAGMHHFLTTQPLEKRNTYFLNLEGVGAGNLHYLTAEGMLHPAPSSKTMTAAAEQVAEAHHASPARLHAIPTETHIPQARGYQTMTIMGLDEEGLPPHWNWYTDRITEVDEPTIANAAAFTDAILRKLDDETPA